MNLWLPIGAPAAVLLVLGAAALWDELREARLDLRRSFTVVDLRTFRHARRRIERLLAAGDFGRAHAGAVAILTWLTNERHHGSARRQRWMAEQLPIWDARRREYFPGAEFENVGDQARE